MSGEAGTAVPQWLCVACGAFVQISHQSTFCKVTGLSDVTMHWCCPGACQLDSPESRAIRAATGKVVEPPTTRESHAVSECGPECPDGLTRGATKLWFYEGAVLEASERGGVSTHDLLEFAQFAQKHHPDEIVMLHAFGLRVTKTAGTAGPRLEWRDWD